MPPRYGTKIFPLLEKIIAKGKNIDFAWEWNRLVYANNTKMVRCDFNKHVSIKGITEAKEHQMGRKLTQGHVTKLMIKVKRKKKGENESYAREDDEMEVQQNLKSKGKRPLSTPTTSCKMF